MPKQEEALVLKSEPSGESFLKLHLLTAESGVFLCLKRITKKGVSSTVPDLFDHAAIILETSQQGTMRFIKEYQLIRRYEKIGQNYRSLCSASRLCQLLVSNAAHMPESNILFDLTTRSFEAFAEGKAPEVVLLKSLYLLLKDEGYPVRESWWPSLPTHLSTTAKSLLQASAPTWIDADASELCARINEHLIQWMRHHTDLIVPD